MILEQCTHGTQSYRLADVVTAVSISSGVPWLYDIAVVPTELPEQRQEQPFYCRFSGKFRSAGTKHYRPS